MRHLGVIVSTVVLTMTMVSPVWAVTFTEIQAALRAADASWTAEETFVWRLYQGTGWSTGFAGPPVLDGTEERFVPAGRREPPPQLDWRDYNGKNYVTPVKDLGQCGACWAFTTTAPIESAVAIANDWPDPQIDLSEQQILSCSFNLGCDYGGFTTTSFAYARDVGVVDEACFPYEEWKAPCGDICADWQERVTKIQSFEIVGEWGVWVPPEDIMAALQVGPVDTSMVIYEDFLTYSSGVYETVIGWPVALHTLTIVGYDADQEYWVCKNEWSDDWGEDGYVRMRWGAAEIGMFTILPRYLPPADDDDDDTSPDDDDDDDDDNDNDNDDNDDNDDNNDNNDDNDDNDNNNDSDDDDNDDDNDNDDDEGSCGC